MFKHNEFLTTVIKKKFHKKFYYGIRKSPYVSAIEIYENEWRISFTKPTKIYYNILTYCFEKHIICNGDKIILSNGEERFKITVFFN